MGLRSEILDSWIRENVFWMLLFVLHLWLFEVCPSMAMWMIFYSKSLDSEEGLEFIIEMVNKSSEEDLYFLLHCTLRPQPGLKLAKGLRGWSLC